MGQKGLIDRIPLAHSRPVLSFDWCDPHATGDSWLASAGFDRTVNVCRFEGLHGDLPEHVIDMELLSL